MNASKIDSTSKVGRPRSLKRKISKSSQEGLSEGWTRATFIVNEEHLDKLKSFARLKQTPIKEIISDAISSYLAKNQMEGSHAD